MSLWNSTDSKAPQLNSEDNGFYFTFVADNETDVESLLEEIKLHDIGELLKQFYPIVAVVTILIAIIGAYLFILLTLWERYGMDPMKRGIINRVSHSTLLISKKC